MTTTEIFYNKEAREKLKAGVDKLANAVKGTLGANGRNVIIRSAYAGFPPHITKDGVTVARNINLLDPVENIGATMVKNVANKVADLAGDGTTSATVLAQEIFNEGLKLIDAGVNPMEMKKGIDKAVAAIVEELKLKSIEVGDDNEKLKQVATISGNNDEAIGNMVAYVFGKVGKEGVVTIDESKTFETLSSFTDGMQINYGYVSPYFVNNKNLNSELEKSVVFVTDNKITMMDTMQKLMTFAQQEGKNLFIVCENLEGEALQMLVKNCYEQKIMGCAISLPQASDRRTDLLNDIATYTGATLVTQATGHSLKSISRKDLGTADKISISRKDTSIVNGGGDKEEINHRVADIRLQAEKETSQQMKDYLNTRAAKLKGGVAVISVGGVSDTEVKEKKDRYDDAIRATQSAIAEGISIGGGVALLRAVNSLKEIRYKPKTYIEKIPKESLNWFQKLWYWIFGIKREYLEITKTVNPCYGCGKGMSGIEHGIDLIARSVLKPLTQICDNSGQDSGYVLKALANYPAEFGYNAKTEKIENLMEAGVIDPTKVIRVALENAASIAGMMLTSECMIVNISEQEFAQ